MNQNIMSRQNTCTASSIMPILQQKSTIHLRMPSIGLFFAFIILLFLFSSPPSFASPTISGNLDTIVLSPSSNPYIVEKDLIIPTGKTVTIPQGCIFLFSPFTGLIVDGTLIVLGSAESPVVFTSINDSLYNKNSMRPPEPFDWNGLLLRGNSHGSHLNHFTLSYSVYGIKSQSSNMAINNGIFRSNGQFHLTANDSILDVKENQPFSFGNDVNMTITAPPSTKKPVININDTLAPLVGEKPLFHVLESKPFRYGALGVGVVGVGIGTVLAIFAGQHQTELERISDGEVVRNKSDWDDEHDIKWRCIAGSSASFTASAIGLTCFSLSFLF
jgi:hypothetical protein